jgi:hypothetical protein
LISAEKERERRQLLVEKKIEEDDISFVLILVVLI